MKPGVITNTIVLTITRLEGVREAAPHPAPIP